MKRTPLILLALALTLLLASCRNETQNIIRRNIQDYTSDRMYITLYTLDGTPVFEGVVDGKVTRASSTGDESQAANTATGDYIFWFDDRARYHQSDLPYLVTSYDRNAATEQ
jgi:hypothetical protein